MDAAGHGPEYSFKAEVCGVISSVTHDSEGSEPSFCC